MAEAVGLESLQERHQVIGGGDLHRSLQGPEKIADHVRQWTLFTRLVHVACSLVAFRGRPVLDDSCGVGDALRQDAAKRFEVKLERGAQQRFLGFAAYESPAEDVVLTLEFGERLVRSQIERAGGETVG